MRVINSRHLNSGNALAVLSGLLFAITFFSEWLGIFGWVCFVPLIYTLKDKNPADSFRLGMITGFFTNIISLYWLVGTLNRFGGFPLPVSAVVIGLFCLYSALQFGIFAYLSSKLRLLNSATLSNAALASAIWVSAEYFFPVLFPYGIGNSQAFYIPVIQVADLLGVKLISFLLVFTNITVVYLLWHLKGICRFPALALTATAFLLVFIFSYGYYRINQTDALVDEAGRIKIGMVQANFDYFEKNLENEFFITERHQEMSRKIENADLIIWPETAIQHWFPLHLTVYRVGQDRNVAPEMEGTHFLIGGLSFIPDEFWNGESFETRYTKYNTAFLTDPESRILDFYNKKKLLLFGEYFPLINTKLAFIKKVIPMMGDLTPGNKLNILEIGEKNIRIGTLICYEDIIPSFGRHFTKHGANLLVNMTNDAWFGKSFAPYQHLLVSIPRAVENRRYFLRSTNSGVSAIISPTGRIEESSGIFTEENIAGEVALLESEPTPYVRLGDIFPWICISIVTLHCFAGYLLRKYGSKGIN